MWIEWNGGEKPPVSDETFVEVRFRNVPEQVRFLYLDDGSEAQDFDWNHDGAGDDIVAYRVVS